MPVSQDCALSGRRRRRAENWCRRGMTRRPACRNTRGSSPSPSASVVRRRCSRNRGAPAGRARKSTADRRALVEEDVAVSRRHEAVETAVGLAEEAPFHCSGSRISKPIAHGLPSIGPMRSCIAPLTTKGSGIACPIPGSFSCGRYALGRYDAVPEARRDGFARHHGLSRARLCPRLSARRRRLRSRR